jgi:predicted glycoside hydrolase/deacetylase ChbG (UPF0249 family)
MNHLALRQIWLCADDYGISPAVNLAIRDLIVQRRINATSVMVVAPSLQRAETTALLDAAATGAAIGLHLTLTAPFQPLSHGFAPLRHGAFVSLAATLRRAHWRAFAVERLAVEILRQFEAFESAFGRLPDFVDGHQHVQLFPQIREVVLRVAKAAAPNAWIRQCGRAAGVRKRFAERKALLLDALSRRFRRLAREYGVRTNSAFAGSYAFDARVDYAQLFPGFLDHLADGAVIMCHPGHVDAELKRLDSLTDLREREYSFFRGDLFPKLLAEHRMALAKPAPAPCRENGNPA